MRAGLRSTSADIYLRQIHRSHALKRAATERAAKEYEIVNLCLQPASLQPRETAWAGVRVFAYTLLVDCS